MLEILQRQFVAERFDICDDLVIELEPGTCSVNVKMTDTVDKASKKSSLCIIHLCFIMSMVGACSFVQQDTT